MYITSTIKTKSSRLAKPVLCLGTLCSAFLTGLNRVSEYRNHCSDVVAGFILGSAVALFLVRRGRGTPGGGSLLKSQVLISWLVTVRALAAAGGTAGGQPSSAVMMMMKLMMMSFRWGTHTPPPHPLAPSPRPGMLPNGGAINFLFAGALTAVETLCGSINGGSPAAITSSS